ncbi:asialoglycoprotein receptor 2-like [Cydia pomonella]|uniref:asialoglycoprotein receptor 2-like n=1 Tax=Cydia pomonella TaxID=82600 RepID=UPI002ADE31A5|nr:asialoglycoprotein receptor 2-like [Cydia pomonella]
MAQFAKVCLILCVGLQYVAGGSNIDYVYKSEMDGWLHMSMEPATWSDANKRCNQDGGVLASPTTGGMAQAMGSMMVKNGEKLMYSVFTGINSIDKEKFTSLDGVKVSSMPVRWASGQPDDASSDENCVELTHSGELAAISCQSELPYFCYKQRNVTCGAKAEGYEWEPRTGSCYKFHRVAKPWSLAKATCSDEGGNLAIINSYAESLVLKYIYKKNPKSLIAGAEDGDYAIIGFKKSEDGEWVTINGDTLAAAGFQGWSAGEPNNAHGWTENCGSIFRDGRLNDCPCYGYSYPFICEITL